MSSSATPRSNRNLVIGFIALALLIGGAVLAVWLVIRLITSVSPQVAASLITASIAALVATVSLFYSRLLDRRKDIEQEHRKQKIPAYEKFMEFWFKALFASKLGLEPVDEHSVAEFARDFSQQMIIWGADDVVTGYVAFKNAFTNSPGLTTANGAAALFLFEEFLFALRRDIGHKNKKLKRGDLLSLFVNDMPSVLDAQQTVQPGVHG